MGRIFKPYYTRPDGRGGRVRVQVQTYYCEYSCRGKTRRVKAFKDKRASETYLARLQQEADRAAAGHLPAGTGDLLRPLGELQAEYLAVLAGRGASAGYRSWVASRLDEMRGGLRWHRLADVTADRVTVWLGRLRDESRIAPATLNGYVRVAKGFARWVAGRAGIASPLASLISFDEKSDRRRSRRILTDAELAALVAAAEKAPRRYKTVIPGRDRAVLYLVAAYTGFRASELASLTLTHFRLDESPPVIRPAARDTKGKRDEPIPVPAHLVPRLRDWLATKPATGRVWPGRWAELRKQVHWLARDLKRAGVAQLDAQNRNVTFHSLRRRYVTQLIRAAGADVKQVQRLARHRDLKTTLAYYVDADLSDLGTVADRLPAVG